MASHLRCLLFHGWRSRGSRVLARIGGLYKTQNAVNGGLVEYRKICYTFINKYKRWVICQMDEIDILHAILKTRAICEKGDKYILFHGTNVRFSQIDLTRAKATSDFGEGFYLTNILEQAVEWAGRKRRIQFDSDLFGLELESAYVLKYELFFDKLEQYNIKMKVFSQYDREWLDTILLGRRHLDANDVVVEDVSELFSEFDVIAGPMADNNLNEKLNNYAKDPYDRNILLEEIKMIKENYQIVFKTEKSLNALSQLEKSACIEF